MPYFRASDPGFFAVTPELLRPLQEASAPFGLRLAYFCLGDPGSDTTPVAAVLEMPPRYVLPRHAHVCHRMEVVLKGALDVGEAVLGPGDVMTTGPGEMYGPHTAGPDGCTTLEIFSSIVGSGEVVYDTAGGPVTVRYLER